MKFHVSRVISFLLVLLIMLLLTGCPGRKEVSGSQKAGEKVGRSHTFIIALLPRENIFYQKRRYRLLAEYLSRVLGMSVKTKLLDSYEDIYKEMSTGQVDAAFFGGLSYVVMDSRTDIDPVARPVHEDGGSTYRGVIFARRDDGINGDVSTWKGKRIALVSKSTTSGYLFPRWYLHEKGVKEFVGYFSRVSYAGSHDGTIREVIDGKADIGCSTDRILDRFLIKNPAVKKDLVILATSGPFPSGTLGIRKGSLDARHRDLIKESLLRMDDTDQGKEVLSALRASRFIETRKSDYDPIVGMMKDLGLDAEFFGLGEIGNHVTPEVPRKP
jgi:phosphonate transport system substrate-binding protein